MYSETSKCQSCSSPWWWRCTVIAPSGSADGRGELGHSLTHLMRALADWSKEHRPAIADSRRTWDEANPESEIR
ncbi:hypothetical protein [Kitasatospora sp. GP82]|uniref:hypothetical protein n=1 Tax=Kitasatospora sp. GP82 TaxID=3035089 RepID=UPI0024733DCF|nr:hypothetical protein [Kitasatospora sp. GP82]MDH6126390.1 hypothetical protein [Kitasatospora sp. GP82]